MKRFGTLLVYAVLVFGPASIYGQDHAATPNAQPQKSHKAQGFADYALGKVNPNDTDYGAALDAARGSTVVADGDRVDTETGLSIADLRDAIIEATVITVAPCDSPMPLTVLGRLEEP